MGPLMAPRRPGISPRWLLAGATALWLALPGCSCCGELVNPVESCERAQDEKAKLQYYTDAAKTYDEGGKYEMSARMWDKVLAQTPDDSWAQFGLAKSLQMVGTVPSLRRAENILVPLLKQDWTHPTQGDVKHRIYTTLAGV